MITRFKFQNVFSYKNEIEFKMLAPNNKVKSRYSDNYVNYLNYDVLKSAIIVGENAGGKSNFIIALEYFKSLFDNTSKRTKVNLNTCFSGNVFNIDLNYETITKEIFEEACKSTLQKFEIEVITSKIYKYVLELNAFGIIKEELYYSTDKNKVFKNIFNLSINQSFLDTKEINCVYDFHIKEDDNLEKIIGERIGENLFNGLLINSLALLGANDTADFINAIKDFVIEDGQLPLDLKNIINNEYPIQILTKLKSKEFFEIFRLIDSSIIDLEIDDEKPREKSIVKRTFNNDKVISRQLSKDSTGVQHFFAFSELVYKVIYEKKTVFADEMDSTLNPILTSKLLSYIHSFQNTGQFIFTTHNIFNLNLQIFMKEQMNIVGKNKENLSSSLYSLSQFKDIRYDSNEKIYEYYMKGLLGGVDYGV